MMWPSIASWLLRLALAPSRSSASIQPGSKLLALPDARQRWQTASCCTSLCSSCFVRFLAASFAPCVRVVISLPPKVILAQLRCLWFQPLTLLSCSLLCLQSFFQSATEGAGCSTSLSFLARASRACSLFVLACVARSWPIIASVDMLSRLQERIEPPPLPISNSFSQRTSLLPALTSPISSHLSCLVRGEGHLCCQAHPMEALQEFVALHMCC